MEAKSGSGCGWLELEAWVMWAMCRVVVGCVAFWLGADGRASQISSHASFIPTGPYRSSVVVMMLEERE